MQKIFFTFINLGKKRCPNYGVMHKLQNEGEKSCLQFFFDKILFLHSLYMFQYIYILNIHVVKVNP